MKQIITLVYYEWLNFKVEKGLIIFSLLLLLCGFYGIYSGSQEIKRQDAQLVKLDTLYQDHLAELKVQFPEAADAGDIGYYHSVFLKHQPDSWAGLAIGQRDVNPTYLKIRLLALYGQLYNSENTNPNKLATGSFDLAFVFVFLLPLFIIAISFNLLSADKENGTLAIIMSQPISLLKFCFSKLVFRFILILSLTMFLLFAGILCTGAVIDSRVLYWVFALILYSLFWLGVVFLIIAFNKSSSFNAICTIGIWLALTIVLPVLINVVATAKRPAPDGLEITLKQREEVHGGWDLPKEQTMQRFFKHYPAFKNTGPIKGRFEWKWYFAFQELGDRSVEAQARIYDQKLADRQTYSYALSNISAPAILQQMFNASAATDLRQHQDFLHSVADFHQRMKYYYYPFLFEGRAFQHQDYQLEPKHFFQAKPDQQRVLSALVVLLLEVVLIYLVAMFAFRFSTQQIK